MRLGLVASLLCLCTVSLCLADPAKAAIRKDLNVPAEDLSPALQQVATTYELQVLYPTQVAKDLKTHGAVGALTSDEALKAVLSGTGLSYKYLDANTVTIVPVAAAATATAADQTQTNTQDTSKEAGKKSSQGFRVAQVDQGQTSGTSTVVNQDEQPSKKKPVQLEEVVVTGTHIKGADPVGSPVLVINEEAIRRSGYTSTEQLIQSLPENIRSGAEGATADHAMSVGASGGFNLSSGSGANLRGLGSSATLVLINGRRYTDSTSGGFIDLSLIPIAAIERIEILTDGASAIYGADAVAGVINVILKQNYDGSEARARYGFTDPSGRNEARLSQSLGKNWNSGNALAVFDYLRQSELSVTDRSFTSSVPAPASIFPENKQLGAVFSGSQKLGDMWAVQADAQYAHVDRFSDATFTPTTYRLPTTIDRINSAVSVTYSLFADWDVSLDGLFSREKVTQSTLAFSSGEVVPDAASSQNYYQTQRQGSVGVNATGTLITLPAGGVGVAVGVMHRSEQYRFNVYTFDMAFTNSGAADRKVDSAYIEASVPLFDESNATKGAQRLALSLAGRYDHYSDFGHTINPKVGLAWSPMRSLELRSSYSTSFRAPSTGNELLTSMEGANRFVAIYSFETPDRTGTLPVAFLQGANILQAEKARNWTAGFILRPESLSGLQIGGTYYDIRYSNRIVMPPFDQGALSNPALQSFLTQYQTPAALLAALTQLIHGAPIFNDSTGPDFNGGAFGPNPQNVTTYLFDDRYTNAGLVRTSGVDLTAGYKVDWLGGVLNLGLNANRIAKIDTAFSPGAPSVDLLGTTGNPARSRFRATAAYRRSGWDAAVGINYTSSYTDTTGPTPTGISSYLTMDSTVRYTVQSGASSILNNSSITLSVVNLLDRNPPYIQSTYIGGHYDSANADPLGRLIALEISKRW